MLREKGWRTALFVFAQNPEGSAALELSERGDVLLAVKGGMGLLRRLQLALLLPWRLSRLFREGALGRADIYVVHNDPVLAAVTWWHARRQGVPFVYRITHLTPESFAAEGGVAKRVVGGVAAWARNRLLKRCDVIVPMSPEMSRALEMRTGIAASTMRPVTSMVEAEPAQEGRANDCAEAVEAVKTAMADRPAAHWLVYLGTLNPGRGLTFLIDTLREVRHLGYDAGLLVLGIAQRPEYRERLEDYAATRGVKDHCVWAPPVPEMCLRPVLAATDVGVSPFPPDPIMRNNSPLKTLEYIRGGIPVVASPIPDNEDVLAASGAGLIAQHDPSAFARAVAELLEESRDQRQYRVNGARHWLAGNRDLAVAAEQWDMILRDVLSQRGA